MKSRGTVALRFVDIGALFQQSLDRILVPALDGIRQPMIVGGDNTGDQEYMRSQRKDPTAGQILRNAHGYSSIDRCALSGLHSLRSCIQPRTTPAQSPQIPSSLPVLSYPSLSRWTPNLSARVR